MIDIIVLSLLATATSFITAVVGMGGGLLLLALLPSFLPPNSVIPIHGTVQLSSNFSRFFFQIRSNLWKPFILFSMGGVLGAVSGGFFLQKINIDYIPVIMSILILTILWTSVNTLLSKVPGKFLSLGIIQTSLSLYVGAVGPLSTSVLHKDGYSVDQVIVTNAAINTTLNIFKLTVYFSIGFIFSDYSVIIILMSVFAILGSYLGTLFRGGIDKDKARNILKIIITLVCIKNLIAYFY